MWSAALSPLFNGVNIAVAPKLIFLRDCFVLFALQKVPLVATFIGGNGWPIEVPQNLKRSGGRTKCQIHNNPQSARPFLSSGYSAAAVAGEARRGLGIGWGGVGGGEREREREMGARASQSRSEGETNQAHFDRVSVLQIYLFFKPPKEYKKLF